MNSYIDGKSGVNVRRLVQNIADQYSFSVQTAAIIELIANCLDANATLIEIAFSRNEGILSVEDNGTGMDKVQFKEYHDFAASTKTKGSGIGFAGQGAKLALNFCTKVISETWSPRYRGYSEWSLKDNEAPYRIFDETTLTLSHFGTKVTLYLDRESSIIYSERFIKEILKEHYLPLIDVRLKGAYKNLYSEELKILLNGNEVKSIPSVLNIIGDRKDIAISVHRKQLAHGLFGKLTETTGIEPGIMVCTFGKVIERTYFRKEPKEKEKITGWIEAPYLIEAVTTDKCRFQAGNKTWESFFRKAQAEFSNWLEKTGLLEKPVKRELNYAGLEKEINNILKNIPELSFFYREVLRDVAIPDEEGERRKAGEGVQKVPGTRMGESEGEGVIVFPGDEPGTAPMVDSGDGKPATLRPRITKGGIRITEDERSDLDQEAWFDGETVTVNRAHAAYQKSKNNDLLNYHLLKCVIMELIRFNIEKDPDPSYQKVFELQQKFFKLWGEH